MALRILTIFVLALHQLLFSQYGIAVPQVNLGTDVSFVYIDHLKRPNTSYDNIPLRDKILKTPDAISGQDSEGQQLVDSTASSTPRSLGLKEAILHVLIQSFKESALNLTLRPDALLTRQESTDARHFDSRSGDPYRQKPLLKFLDTYNIELSLSPRARIRFGVFENIDQYTGAYRPLLEFGLLTILPQHISGVNIDFDTRSEVPTVARPIQQTGTRYSLWIHNGRQDRSELISPKSESFDTGPSSLDTYLGLALKVDYLFHDTSVISAMIGQEDTKIENGRINETYLAINYKKSQKLWLWPWVIGFDSRVSKERWHVSVGQFRELEQQSFSITQKITVDPRWDLTQGFHYGISNRHLEDTSSTETLTGWQVDLGGYYKGYAQTAMGLMMSAESRESTLESSSSGFRSSSNEESYLMRFAAEFRHVLN